MQVVSTLGSYPGGQGFDSPPRYQLALMHYCEITGLPYAEKHHILSIQCWQDAARIPENEIYLTSDLHRLGPDAVHRIGRGTFAQRFGLEDRFEKAKEAVYACAQRLSDSSFAT